MANKIVLKKSSVAAKVPLTTDLDYGELALNYADEKLYFKNSSNVIKSFNVNATGATLTIGTGLSGTSYNGSTAVTIAIDSTVATLTGTQTLTNKTLTFPTIDNIKLGYTVTATAGGTTTLTATSAKQQRFTGSSNQTVVLPVTSTLATGVSYEIENASTGTITVNSSGGNLVTTVPAGITMNITCVGTTLTTAADWDAEYYAFGSITGTGANVLATSPTLVTPNIGAATGTSLSVSGQLTSTVATGTAPLAVTSTTKVTNLNAEMVDGYHADTANTASTIPVRDSSGEVNASGFNASGGMFEHANVISANYAINSGNNAISAGPVTVANGVTVTIPTGSTWVIV